MKYFLLLLSTLFLLLISACTGGSGVETGNYFSMTLKNSDGEPIAGALISRYSLQDYEDRIKQDTIIPISIDTTDSLGKIHFERSIDSSTIFMSQYQGEIGWLAESEKSSVINLAPAVNISAQFNTTDFPQKVFIPGTFINAKVNNNGQFTLLIPQYTDKHSIMIAGIDSNKIRPAGYWNSEQDSFIGYWEPNRFMIARFDAETRIVEPQWLRTGGSQNGGAIWLKEYPESKFFPAGVSDSLELAQAPYDSSFSGRSMRLNFVPDTANQSRYLWVRFVFGKGDEGFDFSCLDSLVFQYKGNAAISLLARNSEGNSLSISIPTQTEWTRISISMSSLKGSSPSWNWDGYKTHISSFIFSSEKAGTFWLDDFEAIGCNLGEVFPSLGL